MCVCVRVSVSMCACCGHCRDPGPEGIWFSNSASPDLLGDFPKAKFPRPVCILVTLIPLPEGRSENLCGCPYPLASGSWIQLASSSSMALRQKLMTLGLLPIDFGEGGKGFLQSLLLLRS